MALVDYLPGIMKSGENITNTLAAMKQMDLQREAMTFDYAINKAKLDAENRRFGIQMGYQERQMKMAEESHKEQIETLNIQQKVAEKEYGYMDERQQLYKDMMSANISATEMNTRLNKLQEKAIKDQMEKAESWTRFQNNLMNILEEQTQKNNKAVSAVVNKSIAKKAGPTTVEKATQLAGAGAIDKLPASARTVLKPFSTPSKLISGHEEEIQSAFDRIPEWIKWMYTPLKGIESMIYTKEKGTKRAADYLINNEDALRAKLQETQLNVRNKVLNEIDKENKTLNQKGIDGFNKLEVMNMLQGSFPQLKLFPMEYNTGNQKYSIPGITFGGTEEERINEIGYWLGLE